MPVAVTMYVPWAIPWATVNEHVPVIVPPIRLHVTVPNHKPVGLLESVTCVSELLKPLPDTVTIVPPPPELGLSIIWRVVVDVVVDVVDVVVDVVDVLDVVDVVAVVRLVMITWRTC